MIDVDVVLVLPAVEIEPLPEVALIVVQADADERNAEIRRTLDVVPGQNAEAARIDRQRLVNAKLGGKVRHRPRPQHAGMARVWQLSVGRSTLLLLDSNVEGNQPEDRELTARLYGGDSRIRIRQELLLGVGGVRALAALGISPGVVHLNEGHSAFAVLELVRRRMELEGIDAKEAIRRVSSRLK